MHGPFQGNALLHVCVERLLSCLHLLFIDFVEFAVRLEVKFSICSAFLQHSGLGGRCIN